MSVEIIIPKLIPVRTTLNGTEEQLFYVPSEGEVQRSIISLTPNFITIDNVVFRFIKGVTVSTKNPGSGLEINDIISDGVIINNGSNVLIIYAIFTGGSSTDFGTYNSTTKEFTGGSYNFIQYKEL